MAAQAIELSADALSNVKFIQEKKVIQKYFDEISQVPPPPPRPPPPPPAPSPSPTPSRGIDRVFWRPGVGGVGGRDSGPAGRGPIVLWGSVCARLSLESAYLHANLPVYPILCSAYFVVQDTGKPCSRAIFVDSCASSCMSVCEPIYPSCMSVCEPICPCHYPCALCRAGRGQAEDTLIRGDCCAQPCRHRTRLPTVRYASAWCRAGHGQVLLRGGGHARSGRLLCATIGAIVVRMNCVVPRRTRASTASGWRTRLSASTRGRWSCCSCGRTWTTSASSSRGGHTDISIPRILIH